jgi:hypothetical protein
MSDLLAPHIPGGQSMKNRYNAKGWPLCRCTECNRLNYVEPHGIEWHCECSDVMTEHENIPYEFGDLFIDIKAAKGK